MYLELSTPGGGVARVSLLLYAISGSASGSAQKPPIIYSISYISNNNKLPVAAAAALLR